MFDRQEKENRILGQVLPVLAKNIFARAFNIFMVPLLLILSSAG